MFNYKRHKKRVKMRDRGRIH